MFKTRVFDLAPAAGYPTDDALAEAMGLSPAFVSRVRNGTRQVGPGFIAGALRAFPGCTFDDLFVVEGRDPAAVA
jgi:hypothetical protein